MGQAMIERKPMQPHRVFLLIAPLLYVAYALLTPPFQTPDEHQHLFRAWQLSEFHMLGERRGDEAGGSLPDGLGRAAAIEIGAVDPHAPRPIIKRPFNALFSRHTPIDTGAPPQFFNFLGSVIYSPAGYLPQVGAIWLGKAGGLSVEDIDRLGRLFNAAVAMLLIYCAMRVTPVGALGLMWVGLLPMTGAASAAFGQDGLAIGGACLLTAIGLRVVLNGGWRRSELLIAAAVTVLLALSKVLYLPLGAVGGQPFARGEIQRRRLVVAMLICLVAAVLASVWLHAVSPIVVPPRPYVPPAAERLGVWLHHPVELLRLLEQTYVAHGIHLFETLFTFGWLTVGPVRSAEVLSLAGLVLVFLAGDATAGQIIWQTRAWLLLIAASIALLISVATYLYWARSSETWIQGLQGRYFIPIAPLIVVAFLRKHDSDAPYIAFTAALMIAANCLVLGTIVSSYYQ